MSRPNLAAVRRRTSSPRASLRRLLVAAGGLVLVAPVVLAAPASAHDSLTGSNPAADAAVTTAPDRVRLTFTDEVKKIGLTVLVKDPAGASVTAGAPAIDGNAVVQRVGALTAPGVYTVAYRVVSSDGHPISGRFTFTLDLPTATPTPTSTPTASATSAPTSAAPTPTESAVAASPAASTSDAGAGSAWVLAGVGLLAALVVTGAVLARRRSA